MLLHSAAKLSDFVKLQAFLFSLTSNCQFYISFLFSYLIFLLSCDFHIKYLLNYLGLVLFTVLYCEMFYDILTQRTNAMLGV